MVKQKFHPWRIGRDRKRRVTKHRIAMTIQKKIKTYTVKKTSFPTVSKI